MKKYIYVSILILISITSYSQIDIGFKGGLNLNFSNEANINGLFTSPNANTAFNSDNDLGYHLGILAEFELQKLGITLRPELLYTKINYEYNGLIIPESQRLTIKKIDVPLLFGLNIKGPFRILVGPSFQFLIDSEFDIDDFKETENNFFSLNAHIGIGLKFDRFDLDIRWEKGLTNSDTNFIADVQNVGLNFDTKPNQLILAVAYRLRIK